MRNSKLKLIDLFAGAGGLSNGFEQTGRFEVKAAVEINKAAQETYIHNHGGDKNIILRAEQTGESDITKIDFKRFSINSSETVVIGGPPCQGFSNANRQKNHLISGNNQLVKEFVRAIKQIRPAAFLMENVKTMNSHVHKFFVTKCKEGKENDFSSLPHLREICKGRKNPLWVTEPLPLLTSEYTELRGLAEYVVQKEKGMLPFIVSPFLITRLRSFERRLQKSDRFVLKSEKEEREVLQLIKELEKYKTENSEVRTLLKQTIAILEKVLVESVKSVFIKHEIGAFVDFNRFLTRLKELQDENILIEGDIQVIPGEQAFEVIALVNSYLIVDYLEQVFKYYGYKLVSDTLDASEFGVPQRRKRFMMLGIRDTENEVKFPKKGDRSIEFTVRDAIVDLEEIQPQHSFENDNTRVYTNIKIFGRLHRYYRRDVEENHIYNHINTKSGELSLQRFKALRDSDGKNFHSLSEELKKSYTDTSRTQNTVYLRLNYNEPSPTVINVRKSMWQHPNQARALSIREAARLQSFRDDFVFTGRKDEQYQQVGNAVPPLLARAVAEQILILLEKPEPISSLAEEIY